MTSSRAPGSPSPERPSGDRLDSWKEIAAYMRRDVTTVQRWEKREAMPVHRHVHDKIGSVYAYKTDLDEWARGRSSVLAAAPEVESAVGAATGPGPIPESRRLTRVVSLAIAAGAIVAAVAGWRLQYSSASVENPLADARFSQLTDFDGIEQAAAVSRDGRFVAFLSDRDGPMDVWVTQVGTGQFHNLTRGTVAELVNPSVRTLGFSPDGAHVAFWARQPGAATGSPIGIWAVPVLGGTPSPYIEGAAEFAWSGDAARLAYHTPGPGDPLYVRDSDPASPAREIFSAPPGLHSHFLVWSPDHEFIYFVQGSVPDRMDIWRIRPSGGTPERMTQHDSSVSYPVFLNARTLLYLATDPDGSGPWIHSIDVTRRIPRRVTAGVDRYTSLAASADGRRVVATLASPKRTLWRVPIVGGRAETSAARRIPLTTGDGSSPRLGPAYLLYVSRNGSGDSIWKLEGQTAAEVWSAPDAKIVGGPAIARDGRRIAFSIKQNGRSLLYVANADGTNARIVASSFELQGAAAWTPDGQAITEAALVDGVPRLFRFPLDSRPPLPFVREYSVDPAWSPDGELAVFSGPDIGTTFEIKAIAADGRSSRGGLTLTRGSRRLCFLMPGRRLVMLRGDLRHKNLWVTDLDTGAEQQLTDFGPDFVVRDFDISPDGREIVVEQGQDHADIVLLDVPPR